MLKVVIFIPMLISSLLASDCASCHPKDAKNCQHSLHYTLKKAINITRVAWGIKDSNVTLQTLPLPKIDIKNLVIW